MKPLIDNGNLIKTVEASITEIKDHFDREIIMNPFYDDFKNVFCWSSNAIEGNTLTLDETITFLSYDEVKSGHSFREYEEAKLLNKAINEMLSFSYCKITEEKIKKINMILIGSEGYRTEPVYIGNQIETVYYPPSYEYVPELMQQFMTDLNFKSSSLEETVKRAALKHIEFERIHPFKDGNGRTGRIILNQILINNGLLPIAIMPKSKYMQSFKRYDKSADASVLENIILKSEYEAIKKVKELSQKYERAMEQPQFIIKKKEDNKEDSDIVTIKDRDL